VPLLLAMSVVEPRQRARLSSRISAARGLPARVAAAGEPLSQTKAVAGSVRVLGVGLLVLQGSAALDPLGLAAALAGTLSMAAGVVLTKRWDRPAPLLVFISWQLVAGGLLLAPLAYLLEGPRRL